MEKLYSISDAAEIFGVSCKTLRLWEKEHKLTPIYTPGGHRRYSESMFEELTKEREKKECTLGNLIEHLLTAQYIAEKIGDPRADDIMHLRVQFEDDYLKEYFENKTNQE